MHGFVRYRWGSHLGGYCCRRIHPLRYRASVYSVTDRCLAACRPNSYAAVPALRNQYGKCFIQVPFRSGSRALSICRFSLFLILFLGLPAGFPTLPALFLRLLSCGGVSVDRHRLASPAQNVLRFRSCALCQVVLASPSGGA